MRIYLRYASHLIRLLIGATGLMFLVSASAFAMWTVIERTVSTEENLLSQSIDEQEKNVQATNDLLSSIDSWRNRQRPWAESTVRWLSLLPSNMSVRGIVVDEKEGTLNIVGTFSDRSSLILFQDRLNEQEDIAEVIAPLSNFATGAEAEFSVTIVRNEK